MKTETLTPNYSALFKHTLSDLSGAVEHLVGLKKPTKEQVLSDLNAILYAIAVPANCMSTREEIAQFRNEVSAALGKVNDALRKLQ